MRPLFWASAFIPIILLAGALFVFYTSGPLGVISASFPPVENVLIERTVLSQDTLELHIINDGPQAVDISQAMVNDAYWQFSAEPDAHLEHLERATLTIKYPWVFGDEVHLSLLSSSGILFSDTIAVATTTPTPSWPVIQTFILLGVYVGVIPVLLGLLWLPFLRGLGSNWKRFMISLTVGLLVFLGIDALAESLELVGKVPSTFNGIGIMVLGFFLAIFILGGVSNITDKLVGAKDARAKSLVVAYLVALAIGLHNLGEGLAIGSAYAVGEIALGSLLVIGFMVHNLTEGVAIVSPLSKSEGITKKLILHLIALGLIAGAPTILGTIVGGFSYSATLSVFFLALGAGAIFDVAYDIAAGMAGKSWKSLSSFENIAGFLSGFAIIYLTGFLVA